MTDTTDPAYRSYTSPDSDAITVRQPEDEEGVFDVRMPIATTGEVRNAGDEPLTREELDGMARQIDERNIGVFLDHGGTNLGGMERYSAIEKIGEWREAEVQTREADDESELVATARLMDPETLPNGVAGIREAIGAIKEQVQRGFSVSASIGWREDDAYPGGNDLMEASIVGIGADPRTTSDADAATVARAAVDAGADPEDLLAQVRAAIREDEPDDARPFGPPGGDDGQWDTFDECVNEVEDWDSIDDPEAFCAWAEEQTKGADTDNHDMSDPDDTPEEGDTTEEQQSEEPDNEQAPEDIGEDDIAEFVAEIYDGVDSTDFTEAMAEAGGEFGGLDEDTVSWFVGDVLDLTASEVMDMLDDGEDGEMDDGGEEDDEEQASDDPDKEQDADQSDLEERLAALEDELASVRSGEVDVETPDPENEQDADDDEQTREANDNGDKYGIY